MKKHSVVFLGRLSVIYFSLLACGSLEGFEQDLNEQIQEDVEEQIQNEL